MESERLYSRQRETTRVEHSQLPTEKQNSGTECSVHLYAAKGELFVHSPLPPVVPACIPCFTSALEGRWCLESMQTNATDTKRRWTMVLSAIVAEWMSRRRSVDHEGNENVTPRWLIRHIAKQSTANVSKDSESAHHNVQSSFHDPVGGYPAGTSVVGSTPCINAPAHGLGTWAKCPKLCTRIQLELPLSPPYNSCICLPPETLHDANLHSTVHLHTRRTPMNFPPSATIVDGRTTGRGDCQSWRVYACARRGRDCMVICLDG
jgi:hypothetical protein